MSVPTYQATWHHIPEDSHDSILTVMTMGGGRGKAVPVTSHGGTQCCEMTLSRQLAHRGWQGCQPYALATLYSQKDSWHSFLLQD
jgi:hypothetical protein